MVYNIYNNIPNFLTLANGLCGMLALILAQQGEFKLGIICIFLGAIFDALDGKVARFIGSSSELGGQLDSLCDCVTFGIAPATLVIFHIDQVLGMTPVWGIVCAAVYMSSVIWRLARFNVETTTDIADHMYFKGLPSPLGAGLVCSALWAIYVLELSGTLPIYFLTASCVGIGWLMVSNIRFVHLVTYLGIHLSGTQFFLLALAALAICIKFNPISWALVCPTFLVISLFKAAIDALKDEEEEELTLA